VREIRFLLELAKKVRSPADALALLLAAATLIGVIYLTPADLLED
jgi:hypothetical protein